MRIAIICSAFLTLIACGGGEPALPPETIENAWVRLPAVDGRPAAAYFVLNGGEGGDTLIAIESSRVERIEMHETSMEDGAMRMRPISAIDVAAGETVTFEPGSKHGMLFGVDPEITPGTELPLNFRLDSGRDVQVQAIAIAAGDNAPFAESENAEH